MIFEKPGKNHTDAVVEIAVNAARERGIGYIVLASHTGFTAKKFMGLDDIKVICVSGVNGAREKGVNAMSKETRQELIDGGVEVVTATHVLSGVERGISTKTGGMYPAEIMAFTLRMFSQGIKVCVEIAIMALDADTVPYGSPVVAVGGTGNGADTVAIVTPSHAASVFETKVHEILCKPY
ncbi:MAG: hypothetical protein FWG21_01495 [Oscillospiraceae bacterium]|jgi:hypothetical protein|nr:hypothetical protein [Oscillospiraceae bacterium]